MIGMIRAYFKRIKLEEDAKDAAEAAVTRRIEEKQKRCKHKFLPCERPHMEFVQTGYDSHEFVQRGIEKYHACQKCLFKVK